MLTTNSILIERKQALRKKMNVAFAKNPEMTEEVMEFLEVLVAQVSDSSQTVYENHRVQNKHEIREELSKELVTKGEFQVETSAIRADILLIKTELQAEIQEVRSEIKLSNIKNAFQTALIVLMILLTTPGGTHLLEKVFPFLR